MLSFLSDKCQHQSTLGVPHHWCVIQLSRSTHGIQNNSTSSGLCFYIHIHSAHWSHIQKQFMSHFIIWNLLFIELMNRALSHYCFWTQNEKSIVIFVARLVQMVMRDAHVTIFMILGISHNMRSVNQWGAVHVFIYLVGYCLHNLLTLLY